MMLDLNSTDDLVDFVRAAHEGQVDKCGNPHFAHIERVADRVATRLMIMEGVGKAAFTNIVHASLLHDVIEDAGETEHTLLERGIDDDVVNMVRIVSQFRREPYESYIERIIASDNVGAMLIKLSDNEDNLSIFRMARLPAAEHERLRPRYIASARALRRALLGCGVVP